MHFVHIAGGVKVPLATPRVVDARIKSLVRANGSFLLLQAALRTCSGHIFEGCTSVAVVLGVVGL